MATVYEASGREGLIDLPLIQLVPGSRAAGPARTVSCGQDDNLMVHACIERIHPGEILVLSMPEPSPTALIGDLLVTQIKGRGAAAIILNGSVRDSKELIDMDLPIWTPFIRVRGAVKKFVGGLDVPVQLGGCEIRPDDIIILDGDGAVCVKKERIDEVLQAAEARLNREENLRSKLAAGEFSYDLHGLRDLVEKAEGKNDR